MYHSHISLFLSIINSAGFLRSKIIIMFFGIVCVIILLAMEVKLFQMGCSCKACDDMCTIKEGRAQCSSLAGNPLLALAWSHWVQVLIQVALLCTQFPA